ncbi:uncharacterized protein ATC70_005435 [Mucor velutinosus]|uniref:Uncharacterized protein n=1 Tax=Mucor velutinosus TaxID=708070 RepID=A0AAN7DBC0_9FUNG|nr:hypothetical protein ATC70_005435 [Mucor velutinosus]
MGFEKNHSKAYSKYKPVEKLAEGESRYDIKIHKKCAGALRCLSLQCKRPEWVKNQRPPVDWKDELGCLKKFQCPYCEAPLKRIDCGVGATFTFRVTDIRREDRGSTVTMYQETTEKKKHTHTVSTTRFILIDTKKKDLNNMVKDRPNITAAAAIAGIDPSTGAITKSVREINSVMANHGRTKYEIRKSKVQ